MDFQPAATGDRMNATSLPGYPRLLALVDDSPLGRCTATEAVRLASALGAELVFLAAIPAPPPMMAEVEVAMLDPIADHERMGREQAARAFEMAQGMAHAAGLASRTLVTLGAEVAEAAHRAAVDHDCAMIIVGSHGRGTLARLVLGSPMAHLTQLTDRPVLVVKQRGEAPATDSTSDAGEPVNLSDVPPA
jgi:nucleotide-binding universal stress UspA family protein